MIRICARYNNLDIIEDVYGINLIPLLNLADKYYHDRQSFQPKVMREDQLSEEERLQITKIHQAIAIIQFKLEMQIMKRRPEFQMEHRMLLEHVDFEKQTIDLNGKRYPLKDTCFATVDPIDPGRLLDEETQVINRLLYAMQHSEKLARHMNFLVTKGSLYLNYNGNLLIHGCIPLNEDGSMRQMTVQGKHLSGKQLLDAFEHFVRESFAKPQETDDFATDMFWYLWTGENSSLFGKKEMTTFERYFIEDKSTHVEQKNPYYTLREQEHVCRNILREFGLDPDEGHIINGHTPVEERNGENPIKSKRQNDCY
ncbi:fructose-1,6-bisphosphatase, Bacillus type [Sporolactobacillus inulinus]|uniref:Fructose-1,6-bisphosphatase, Bacillus type n=1 Tax=Sporolactobacillus inulinus TaxID=2078 RepID=A0A4Y1Z855_9BACL|nr:fructose-1,6-bisphosphatase, Bacillus type [Sporolactobacillus inulinus]